MRDITIIGSGIVGLATGLQLLQQDPRLKVRIIEKENQIAAHQTGHNSGVIHSGLYYKPGSLKARNCIEGYKMLVEFCDREGVNYDLCGKIVVATDEQERNQLRMLADRGRENGLTGLLVLESDEIKEHEPFIHGVEGLYVPQTGIVDYKDVSQKILDCFLREGGEIMFNQQVVGIHHGKKSVISETDRDTLHSKQIINCAGLFSDRIAGMTLPSIDFRIIPFRGEYYQLKPGRENLIRNLVYPVPDPSFPFLGVHFTRMIKGGVEAGPNAVLAFKREGYRKADVHAGEFLASVTWPGFVKLAAKYWKTGSGEIYRSLSKSAFTKALNRLMPELKKDDLVAGGAGVRAQACLVNGSLVDDFLIVNDGRVIHLCNAPSPAATSSLSIGLELAKRAIKSFEQQ